MSSKTIEERFAHVSAEDKAQAVDGIVRINPHLSGIDFSTMMEMVLDSDAHLSILGDVEVEGEEATKLVQHFANLRRATGHRAPR